MSRRPWLAAAALLLLAWLASGRRFPRPAARLPVAADPPAASNPGLLARRAPRSPEQAALLALEGRPILAGARALEAAGVPFAATASPAEALRHRLVLVPLDDRAAPLSPALEDALLAWLKRGGVLVLTVPSGDDLWTAVTGLDRIVPSAARRAIDLRLGTDPAGALLMSPEELSVPLRGPKAGEGFWTAGLRPRPGGAEVLAVYDDKEPALLRRRVGRGTVYTLGAPLTDLTLRPQAGRHLGADAAAPGPYRPAADVWPTLLRAWARAAAPVSARLRGLPGRASGVLALSHEADPSRASREGAEKMAALETARGARAAWLVRADPALLNPGWTDLLRSLAGRGHELACLGVSSLPDFESIPFGTGQESLRGYRPTIDGARSSGASLLGELGVGRAFLESRFGVEIRGFAAPRGAWPEALDLALLRAGYLYDASLSAGQVLSHRPFLLASRRALARESPIIEIPATFAAGEPVPSPSSALKTLRAVSRSEGILSWRVPLDRAGRAALSGVLARLPRGVETWTLGNLAAWRRARAATNFWLEPGAGDERILVVEFPEGGAARLSFELSPPARSCAPLETPPGARVRCEGGLVLADSPSAGRLRLRLNLE